MLFSRISLLLLSICVIALSACGWYIAPPASKADWEQLAKLLAQESAPQPPGDDKNAIANLQWNLWGQRQTQDALYRRYVRTARQLKGSKYAVLVAKEWGQVLGVAEMGKDEQRRPILGVLSVSPIARRQGIGAALVQKCEEIAVTVWQEEKLWVEVETTNHAALHFFQFACGYTDTDERSMVAVQRRQGVEEKPHVVLSKSLQPCDASVEQHRT